MKNWKKSLKAAAALLAVLAISCNGPGGVTAEAGGEEELPYVTLYLTRHGKTMLNTTGRMQGWCDSPLTADGRSVAECLGRGLQKQGIVFDAVYSSDSGRAVETANLVLQRAGQENLPVMQKKQLREVCYGIYEGAVPAEAYEKASGNLGYSNVNEMMGAVFAGKMKIQDAVTAMAGTDATGAAETWDQASSRMNEGLRAIADEARSKGQTKVLVVSHGMAISAAISAINPELAAGELGNASISEIVYDGTGFVVESVNDMSYIEAGK